MAAAAFASINALGRNPSAAPKIFTAMTITLIFAEALAIIAMLIIFQLFQAG
jgi:F0F1-type ATP synthase membrane subunit c/vacuolar-type H+-ATPase subunit K